MWGTHSSLNGSALNEADPDATGIMVHMRHSRDTYVDHPCLCDPSEVSCSCPQWVKTWCNWHLIQGWTLPGTYAAETVSSSLPDRARVGVLHGNAVNWCISAALDCGSLCHPCFFCPFLSILPSNLPSGWFSRKAWCFYLNCHTSHNVSMCPWRVSQVIRGWWWQPLITQIKSESFTVWCEPCGASSGRQHKASTSGSAGLPHARLSWWAYQLFNSLPHPGRFSPLHAAPALSCWCCSAFCHLGQLVPLCLSVVLCAIQGQVPPLSYHPHVGSMCLTSVVDWLFIPCSVWDIAFCQT